MALYSFLKQSVFGLMVVLLFPVVSLGQQSPYAGQQSREIKALSSTEVQGSLSGNGMGFAKAAELNHYPGPKHVLELADKLHLTEPQRTQTLSIYESMRQDAIRLGTRLVEAERHLDHLFATQGITEDKLKEITSDSGLDLDHAFSPGVVEAFDLQGYCRVTRWRLQKRPI